MIKYVLPVALLIGATAPAFAAEYFIVRGSGQEVQDRRDAPDRQDGDGDRRQGLRHP